MYPLREKSPPTGPASYGTPPPQSISGQRGGGGLYSRSAGGREVGNLSHIMILNTIVVRVGVNSGRGYLYSKFFVKVSGEGCHA